MPEIKLGLAPGKNGFFDSNTNFYLSLSAPVQVLTYTEQTNMEKIAHAVLASVPALVIYDGVLPQDVIDAWKTKFDKIFRTPLTRKLVENGKVIGEVPINYAINHSVQDTGRLADGNRAFDRTDELEDKQSAITVPPVTPPESVEPPAEDPPAEPIVGANVGDAEVIDEMELKAAEVKTEKKKPAARSTKKAE